MIAQFMGVRPDVDQAAYIAPGAMLIGKVSVGASSSVWFGAVLRGDVESIGVGCGSNLQDGSIVHTSPGFPVRIGNNVTIGHGAKLHGCIIEDGALVGIGAIVLDGAVVGRNAMIAANTVIPPGHRIPEGALAVGTPGKVKRMLTDEERLTLGVPAEEYVRLKDEYLKTYQPIGR